MLRARTRTSKALAVVRYVSKDSTPTPAPPPSACHARRAPAPTKSARAAVISARQDGMPLIPAERRARFARRVATPETVQRYVRGARSGAMGTRVAALAVRLARRGNSRTNSRCGAAKIVQLGPSVRGKPVIARGASPARWHRNPEARRAYFVTHAPARRKAPRSAFATSVASLQRLKVAWQAEPRSHAPNAQWGRTARIRVLSRRGLPRCAGIGGAT